MCQPHVAANDGTLPNDGVAAQDGGSGINHDIVFYRRMALLTANELAFLVHCETACAKRHTLVQLDVIANDCRFSNDNTRSMINEKPAADVCTGMNIDSCYRVSVFGHDPRQQRHSLNMQFMCDSEYRNGDDGRVGKNHFIDA